MAAHRYWRVRFSSASGGDVWLSELEFLAAGTAAIVPPTSHSVSGTYSASYTSASLFDGVKTSGNGWASNSQTCWVAVDFTNPVDIEAARIYNAWQPGSSSELPIPGSIFLEYSDNNSTWVEQSREVYGGSNYGADLIVGVNRLPAITKQARYWKLTNVVSRSDVLNLTRIELWNGTNRVCQNATLTSSFPADYGTTATLKTESTNVVLYNYDTRKAFPDFTWDAGDGNTLEVLLVRFAGGNEADFIKYFTLSYSTDGVNWTVYYSSQRFALKYPGSTVFTPMPAVDRFFTPMIEALGTTNTAIVDNVAKTVNLTQTNVFPMRAILPITSGQRQYMEITLPTDNNYPWTISIMKPDIIDANAKGINDPGNYAGITVYKRTSTISSFGGDLGNAGQLTIFPGFTSGGVLGIAVDSSAGLITFFTSSGKVGWKGVQLTQDNLFLVISRDYSINTNLGVQDRIFSLNFGQNAFVRGLPAGYSTGFGFLYEYENTSIYSGGATSLAGAFNGVPGPDDDGDKFHFSQPSKVVQYQQYCGRGYIKNRVYTKGTPNNPARKKIVLFDLATNICVGETVSDVTGLFEFKFLDEKLKYVAMALDELGQWEPACTGPITPSIMPLITV